MFRYVRCAILMLALLAGAALLSSLPDRAAAQTTALNEASLKNFVVERAYQDVLNRSASPAELANLASQLGVVFDETDLRVVLLGSGEFFDNVDQNRQEFIFAAYRNVFGRLPIHGEYADAAQKLAGARVNLVTERQRVVRSLLERSGDDLDSLGVRELSLSTNASGEITAFMFELDANYEPTDETHLTVSILGQQLDGEIRRRAADDLLIFRPDEPVVRVGEIVALVFVTRDGVTEVANISTPSNNLPARTSDFPEWPDAVYEDQRVIAHYGSHATSVLGVLGETGPVQASQRVQSVAAQFNAPGKPAVGAFEMIVTVAQASAGSDGNFSTPSDLDEVSEWIDVAEQHGLYVILDIQPGRSDFLTESRRYESLLMRPNVGLALDPEWRMGPNQRPGEVVGRVSAEEVNQVSAWLSDLVIDNALPEKIFIIHQFQERMVTNRDRLIDRPGLATTIHADGFGSQVLKQATYSRIKVAAPFFNGFKLFIDEDTDLYEPAEVLQFTDNPVPDFVSYQ